VVWVWERERKSEGDGGSNKWKGKEWKKEGEEKKEEAVAGQRTKTDSTGSETGSTGFAAAWTIKARRKRCWLCGKPATLIAQSTKLTAQTAGLTDSADAEATKTSSPVFIPVQPVLTRGKPVEWPTQPVYSTRF
jgi:hypothetical protein